MCARGRETLHSFANFLLREHHIVNNKHNQQTKQQQPQVIDPVAPRYTAILKSVAVPLLLEGVEEKTVKAQKHPKDPSVGEKDVFYSSKIFLEGEDASVLKSGEKVTLVNWGNAVITSVNW